jgi:hypothetical protein
MQAFLCAARMQCCNALGNMKGAFQLLTGRRLWEHRERTALHSVESQFEHQLDAYYKDT